MSASTVAPNVPWVSAPRSAITAAEITTAPAGAREGPPATAQARTDEATHVTGRVGAPASMRLPVSTSLVLRTRSAPTATSAQISHGVRPRGVAYAVTVTTVHAAMTASATNPAPGWA